MPVYSCNFCGRSAQDVECLFAGPSSICSQCVSDLADTLERHRSGFKFEPVVVEDVSETGCRLTVWIELYDKSSRFRMVRAAGHGESSVEIALSQVGVGTVIVNVGESDLEAIYEHDLLNRLVNDQRQTAELVASSACAFQIERLSGGDGGEDTYLFTIERQHTVEEGNESRRNTTFTANYLVDREILDRLFEALDAAKPAHCVSRRGPDRG